MPTYPLSTPPMNRAAERLYLNRRQTPHASPYSGHQQTVDLFTQWTLSFSFPPMPIEDAERVAAWLDSLRGARGTFRYQPHYSGDAALTSRTLAENHFAYSNILAIGGWTAGAASRLFAGQFLQVGDQLLRVSAAPANADGSGICEIEVEPYLRDGFTTGTAVNFVNPKGLFRLTGAEQTGYGVSPGNIAEFGPITAEEAL